MKTYPDVSNLLEQKRNRRKRLASLSFEEKIAIVNKWRALTRQIKESEFAKAQKARSLSKKYEK